MIERYYIMYCFKMYTSQLRVVKLLPQLVYSSKFSIENGSLIIPKIPSFIIMLQRYTLQYIVRLLDYLDVSDGYMLKNLK